MDDFHRFEAEKVFDALIALQSQRIQLGVFFGTINLTAIGIALTTRLPAVLVLSAFFPILCLLLDMFLRSITYPYCLRARGLHHLLAPHQETSFLKLSGWFLGPRVLQELERSTLPSLETATSRQLWGAIICTAPFFGFCVPLIAATFQILIGILLWSHCGWDLKPCPTLGGSG